MLPDVDKETDVIFINLVEHYTCGIHFMNFKVSSLLLSFRTVAARRYLAPSSAVFVSAEFCDHDCLRYLMFSYAL